MSLKSSTKRRERWPSRFSYLVASASSIIGIGNFVRFPGIAARYSGITFLIPYFILTWLVGYSMVTFETAAGEMYRSSMITFLDRVYSRFRGFGILQMVATLICMSYLNVILGWILVYMVRSSYIPWDYNPKLYFQTYILNQKEFRIDVVFTSALSAAVIWIILFITIYKGVTHSTKIIYLTLPLSILMMSMLLIRSLTLPDSFVYLYNTMSVVDWKALLKTKIWLESLGQVLFSLCIGIGSSSAYGSYRIKDGYLMKDAFVVVTLNFVVELLGWIIIICIGGNEDWDNLDIAADKFSLAFVLYPQLVNKLPYPHTWSFLYYLFMLTFGINCSHGSLESIVTSLIDSRKYSHLSRIEITTRVLLVGGCGSIFFCLAVSLIDPVDYFASNFLLVLAALGEVLLAGFFYNKQLVTDQLGDSSVNVANFSLLLGPLIGSFLYFMTRNNIISVTMAFLISLLGCTFAVLTTPSKLPTRKVLYLLFSYQGKILIHHFNDTLQMSGRNPLFKLNLLWYFSIKYLTTPLMISLLSISIFNMQSFTVDYFIVGTIIAIIGLAIVFLPWYLPNMFSSFVPEAVQQEENRLHLDEFLRYWFKKEKKILTGETPPMSRRTSLRL